ncbi:ty1-copia retrotransposon protein [Cucumis melo var. makuwa]|uniref:Ty1-copia retrotransposon protein n=1 Tax=Cucumis melo var. makuwa TaxID=1194695 RepID=A0A5D3D1G2_CUCMM|nr:ty1-copia retrotransposon protein [Cucumis melo var. makuwa]TYK17064.1 ty1-copia retrotransposon protein [Cucumis melo var. makuwa]
MEQITTDGPKKLFIFFKQLEVDYVLTIDPPSNLPVTISSPTSYPNSSMGSPIIFVDQVKQVSIADPEKYAKDNKTVYMHLLNHMLHLLFDMFVAQKSVKDI